MVEFKAFDNDKEVHVIVLQPEDITDLTSRNATLKLKVKTENVSLFFMNATREEILAHASEVGAIEPGR